MQDGPDGRSTPLHRFGSCADDCILIGGDLVDVEMLQAELRTLGVEAALELEAVVSLDIAQGEGELLSGVIQGQERSSFVQFG